MYGLHLLESTDIPPKVPAASFYARDFRQLLSSLCPSVSWDSIFITSALKTLLPEWMKLSQCVPCWVLTQGTSAETVVCPRLGLGLVAVEDLLHELLHWEPWTAVAIAACPLDAMNCKENSKISHQKLQNHAKTIKSHSKLPAKIHSCCFLSELKGDL